MEEKKARDIKRREERRGGGGEEYNYWREYDINKFLKPLLIFGLNCGSGGFIIKILSEDTQ